MRILKWRRERETCLAEISRRFFENINVDDKSSNSSQSEQANVKGKMFQFFFFGKKKAIMVNTLMKNMTCILLQFCWTTL